jgi:integrase
LVVGSNPTGPSTLRMIFVAAIEYGMIFRNPAEGIPKRRPSRKHLELPSREEFTGIVNTVRSTGAWRHTQCGDLIEFLAYSGCRIDEARNVRWTDVEGDSIWIRRGETGTKNGCRIKGEIKQSFPLSRFLDMWKKSGKLKTRTA